MLRGEGKIKYTSNLRIWTMKIGERAHFKFNNRHRPTDKTDNNNLCRSLALRDREIIYRFLSFYFYGNNI